MCHAEAPQISGAIPMAVLSIVVQEISPIRQTRQHVRMSSPSYIYRPRNPAWKDLRQLVRESGFCITDEFFDHLIRVILPDTDTKADIAAIWALFRELRKDHRQPGTVVAVASVLAFYSTMLRLRGRSSAGACVVLSMPYPLATALPSISLRLLMVYRQLAVSPAVRQRALVDFANLALMRKQAGVRKNVRLL